MMHIHRASVRRSLTADLCGLRHLAGPAAVGASCDTTCSAQRGGATRATAAVSHVATVFFPDSRGVPGEAWRRDRRYTAQRPGGS